MDNSNVFMICVAAVLITIFASLAFGVHGSTKSLGEQISNVMWRCHQERMTEDTCKFAIEQLTNEHRFNEQIEKDKK